jgi:hypothetical protein
VSRAPAGRNQWTAIRRTAPLSSAPSHGFSSRCPELALRRPDTRPTAADVPSVFLVVSWRHASSDLPRDQRGPARAWCGLSQASLHIRFSPFEFLNIEAEKDWT